MILAAVLDSRELRWIAKPDLGVSLAVTELEHGDLHIITDSGLCIFERKTPGDFLNRLRDGTLFTQVAGCLSESRYVYIIITGFWVEDAQGKVQTVTGHTGWSMSAVQGALLVLQSMGAMIAYCKSDADYSNTVLMIANKNRNSETVVLPSAPARVLSDGHSLLCSLPGIGLDRSLRLIEQCGSAAWALVALSDRIEIPGVPESIRHKAREALGLAPGYKLEITSEV